mmetsp:Transcript_20947/g.37104  ORF Transcript_20947/g.37104 Transcript_20947/m.37104 type:complete len:217 (+) Transcript_20947:592-1242(+)
MNVAKVKELLCALVRDGKVEREFTSFLPYFALTAEEYTFVLIEAKVAFLARVSAAQVGAINLVLRELARPIARICSRGYFFRLQLRLVIKGTVRVVADTDGMVPVARITLVKNVLYVLLHAEDRHDAIASVYTKVPSLACKWVERKLERANLVCTFPLAGRQADLRRRHVDRLSPAAMIPPPRTLFSSLGAATNSCSTQLARSARTKCCFKRVCQL